MAILLVAAAQSFGIDWDTGDQVDGLEGDELNDFADIYKRSTNYEDAKLHIYTHVVIFRRMNAIEHLEYAIQQAKYWVDTTPTVSQHQPQQLRTLAYLLSEITRFRHKMGSLDTVTSIISSEANFVEELDYAISITSAALNRTQRDHPDRGNLSNDLGCWLAIRFHHTGLQRDIDSAIEVAAIALDAIPADDSNLVPVFINLATWHAQRFESSKRLEDIDRAIELGLKALDVKPPIEEFLTRVHINLATWYGKRFDSTRSAQNLDSARASQDLDQAIDSGMKALENLHLYNERIIVLGNLGTRLGQRSELTGSKQDLDTALDFISAALSITPPTHHAHGSLCTNLSTLTDSRNVLEAAPFQSDDHISKNTSNEHEPWSHVRTHYSDQSGIVGLATSSTVATLDPALPSGEKRSNTLFSGPDETLSIDSTSGYESSNSNFQEAPWLTNLFDVTGSLHSSHPYMSVKDLAVESVIKAYQGGEKETTAGGSAYPSQSSGSFLNSNDTKSQKFTRKYGQVEDGNSSAEEGDGDDDDDRRRHRPTAKRKRVSEGDARLACPFQKRDPERHPRCGINREAIGFPRITDVKQHIKRKHVRNPNYCSRCKEEFDTAEAKDVHVNDLLDGKIACPQSSREIEGVPYQNLAGLASRVDGKLTLKQQWFSIWDFVFPGIPRPLSCTMDLGGDISSQVLGYQVFVENQGPKVVLQVLKQNKLLTGTSNEAHSTSVTEENDSYIRQVLREALQALLTQWRTQRSELSSLSTPPVSGNCVSEELSIGLMDSDVDPKDFGFDPKDLEFDPKDFEFEAKDLEIDPNCEIEALLFARS
jgi:tetratricopeptide (TPR) repeat protein